MRYGNDNHNNKRKPYSFINRLENPPGTIYKRKPWKCYVMKIWQGGTIWRSKETEKRLKKKAFTCSCYSFMKLKFNSLMFYVYICLFIYICSHGNIIFYIMQIKSTSKRSLEHAKRIICFFCLFVCYMPCVLFMETWKNLDFELHYGNWEIKLNYPILPIITYETLEIVTFSFVINFMFHSQFKLVK